MIRSYIYNEEGTILEIDEQMNGLPFFRKMTTDSGELKICRMIKERPHPNIVNILRIGPDFVDMELVEPCHRLESYNEMNVCQDMARAMTHLREMDILYIDWKYDNVGRSKDGQ